MCVIDIDLTEPEQDTGELQTESTYPGVAWGRHRDGQNDRDGQDVAKPVAAPSR